MSDSVVPTNGMVLTENTTLAPGIYHLPDGIRIAADGITVDGTGVTIISDTQDNIGVHIDGCDGVRLTGLTINGFYHGVRVDHASDITLENLTVRGTHEIAGIETFLHLWQPIDTTYGGAILCYDVQESRIIGCDLQHQMHSVLLYDCERLTVARNNASFNSGWGVYLSHTNASLVEDNQLDFCNRVFKRESGTVRVEADAAGIVLVKGSSRNKFLRNSCLCGGDGVFLCGYEHPGVITPCNDNLFEENDCRLSPNNAIEATFSEGNIFRRNDCSRSNYAFWMGYSSHNTLEENTIEFSRWVGIAIEHGFGFTIRNNRLHNNGEGIRLFTRGSAVLPHFPQHTVCYDFDIRENDFHRNNIGFRAFTGAEIDDVHCHDFTLRGNTFADNRVGVQVERVRALTLTENDFRGNLITAIQQAPDDTLTLSENTFDDNGTDQREITS